MPGPPPKRKAQRRRRNEPAGGEAATAAGAPAVVVPRPNSKWHPVAKLWFTSLATSGQAKFYEPSDWATATLVAEAISRDLKPQFVAVTDDGTVVKEALPIKGASLSAYLKAMTALMVCEGDRRRLRLELERPGPNPAEREDPKVARMSDHVRRFAG